MFKSPNPDVDIPQNEENNKGDGMSKVFYYLSSLPSIPSLFLFNKILAIFSNKNGQLQNCYKSMRFISVEYLKLLQYCYKLHQNGVSFIVTIFHDSTFSELSELRNKLNMTVTK